MIDIEGKKYFSKKTIFADLFNYYLHDGKQIIDPEKLVETDTTEIAIPYGNNARIPIQKYRDILKKWAAMKDDKAYYVLLGAELQAKTHYAMPVKKGLYDMLGYAGQIENARDSYRRKKRPNKARDDGTLCVEDDSVKVKLTSEEFLSGFRKEDKLIPIITVTVYLSDEEWNGPLDLYDMLKIEDEDLLRFIPNYPINLIAPASISGSDFDKFSTDLGLVFNALKGQKSGIADILQGSDYKSVERDSAEFLSKVANLELEFNDGEGFVDMCKAMEENNKKQQIIGAIQGMRLMGASDNAIIEKIINTYNVKKEYVISLLTPQKV